MQVKSQKVLSTAGAMAIAFAVGWPAPGMAQMRCTMPNGVVITQELGGCPRDAVAAQRLDGTPVPAAPAVRPSAAGASPASSPSTPAPAQRAAPSSAVKGDSGFSFGWAVVFLLLAYGLYLALKGSAGVSGPMLYCATCGHKGRGKMHTRGSLAIEIVLWLSFLVPGVIYTLWRHGSKRRVCAKCGAATLIPLNSPVARAQSATPAREVDPPQQAAVTDAWEGSFYDAPVQRTAKKSVRIIYRDGNGTVTERVVDIRAFEPEGTEGMVYGRCQMRDASRTFRFDRMLRVVDEETGEIIPNLQAHLNAEWQASPQPILDALYRQHSELLKIVLYAAKADGAVRAAELEVIAAHCRELTNDDRISPDMVRQLLAAFDVPSITSFTRLYNKLRREQPEMAARVARACREIVGTQKTIHPAEQVLLDALNKPLPAAS